MVVAPTILTGDQETHSVPDSVQDLLEYLSRPIWWYASDMPVGVRPST